MTLSEDNKQELIKYRPNQADDSIEVVELLIANQKLSAAVNRIYYGIFYALLALAIKHEFTTSKHHQLIGLFNREFIKTGKIDNKYGEILKNAYENRTSGDYDSFVEFEKNEIKLLLEEMKNFINHIRSYVRDN